MKSNRRTTRRMSVAAATATRFGVIILFFFVMVIIHMLSSSSCTQLMKVRGEKKRELAKLEEARTREASRWEEMKTPERIEAALFRRGMKMATPRHDQVVRVRSNGMIAQGQTSVARAMQRSAAGALTAVSAKKSPVRRKVVR